MEQEEEHINMKKVLLPLLMFVLLSSVVFSALTDSEVIYLNFTADGNDYWETYDFTCTGVDFTNNKAQFGGLPDKCVNNAATITVDGSSMWGCMEICTDSLPATMIVYDETDSAGNDGLIYRIANSGGYKFNLWLKMLIFILQVQ